MIERISIDWASPENIRKIKTDFRNISGENMEVQFVKSAYYAFGSELAVLRLFHEYNKVKRNIKTGTGISNQGHYFVLDV